ncbi:MAG: homoserine kinase [Candidatus Gastranaerophilales bacterium]|nr:homoserine kinase [Candidatus Gastranaerophilales bacterium]
MKVSVKVPATSANIGPGFDCFGIALPMYNIVTIEELVDPNAGIQINVFSDEFDIGEFHIPTDKSNIVYRAVDLLFTYIGQTPHSMRINIQSNIPLAKGLGSSASVIVGGLMATNELLGSPADEDTILSIATEIEGHPDNISAAVKGGFVLSSAESDGSVTTRKLDWPRQWKLLIGIPDYELSTSISRSVLPEKVSLSDAAFNARRAAMLVEAIHLKDAALMKLAMKDRLHQPYRMKLVPGLDEIITNLKHVDNVLGCALSGAGPSILVVCSDSELGDVKKIIKETWSNYSVNTDIRVVDVEPNGAKLL